MNGGGTSLFEPKQSLEEHSIDTKVEDLVDIGSLVLNRWVTIIGMLI